MKRVLLLMSALVLCFACAAREGAVKEGSVPGEGTRLTAIDIVPGQEGQEIRITADAPVPYTVYKPGDPYLVVVEMPGVVLDGVDEKVIKVNEGNLVSISPLAMNEPSRIIRLEIALSAPVELGTEADGNVLVVRVPSESVGGPAAEGEAMGAGMAPVEEARTPEDNVVEMADEAGRKAPSSDYAPPPLGDRIEDVVVSAEDGRTVVRIVGNGLIAGDVFSLSDDRIVVDIPKVTTDLQYVTVSGPALDRVRLGQHSDKVRVVLDVKEHVNWDVKEEGNALVLSLTEAATPMAAVAAAPVVSEPEPVAVDAGAEAERAGYVAVRRPAGKALASAGDLNAEAAMEMDMEGAGSRFMAKKVYTGTQISLDFQNADVVQVLRLIAEVRGMNLVIHPEVTGSIPSLKLMNVPADQAQEIVLNLAGMKAEEKNNILRVAPAAVFAKEQDELKRLREAEEQAQPLAQTVIQINYAKADEVRAAIQNAKILSDRGEVTVDKRTNKLIVKDIEANFPEVLALVDTVDRPKPQVQIQARIVEVSKNSGETLGINWSAYGIGNPAYGPADLALRDVNARGTIAGALATDTSFNNVQPAADIVLGSIDDYFALGLRIDALETTGDAKTISNPRIVTLDNEEAVITQGEQIPYQTVSQEGTQTQFKDAALELKVTPTIAPNGFVQIELEINNDFRGDDTPAGPIINKSTAKTRALVKTGETMVVGGVFQTRNNVSYRKTPLLGDIPFVGWLFKTKTDVKDTREIMIFITPSIVEEAL